MVLPADASRLQARFGNWVWDVTGVLREYTEALWLWPARGEIAVELAQHGFAPLPGAGDPAVLPVRRA